MSFPTEQEHSVKDDINITSWHPKHGKLTSHHPSEANTAYRSIAGTTLLRPILPLSDELSQLTLQRRDWPPRLGEHHDGKDIGRIQYSALNHMQCLPLHATMSIIYASVQAVSMLSEPLYFEWIARFMEIRILKTSASVAASSH